MRRAPNITALTGGLVVIVLGVLLVLAAGGQITLRFAYTAAAGRRRARARCCSRAALKRGRARGAAENHPARAMSSTSNPRAAARGSQSERALLLAGGLLLVRPTGLWPGDPIVWPVAGAVLGALLIWRAPSPVPRARRSWAAHPSREPPPEHPKRHASPRWCAPR